MTMSGAKLVEAIERTPLAWPMAMLVAAATAFLAYAVPAAIVERAVAAIGSAPLAAAAVPFGAVARAVLALAAAGMAGGAIWAVFRRLDGARPGTAAEAEPEIDLFAPVPAAAAMPQLRRADIHPDAPARRPIFAASDLGAPMDDVHSGQTPFGRPPLFGTAAPVAAAAALPVHPPVAADARAEDDDNADLLLLDARYGLDDDASDAMPAPGADPGPAAPIAALPDSTESIAGLMARLERGLERRGGAAAGAVTPIDAGGDLRHALNELRRMTMGR